MAATLASLRRFSFTAKSVDVYEAAASEYKDSLYCRFCRRSGGFRVT
jgi:hypothetical protein